MFTHKHTSMDPHQHATVADARICSSSYEARLANFLAGPTHFQMLGDDEPDFGAYLRADELEAERERNSEWAYHAPTIADAHSHWHAVNGATAVCPLDCGVNEGHDEDYADAS